MTKIIISVPDDFDERDTAVYVKLASYQIEEGYKSGHVAVDHWWEFQESDEGRPIPPYDVECPRCWAKPGASCWESSEAHPERVKMSELHPV